MTTLTLIERWRATEHGGIAAVNQCADEFEDACTPRAPKASWFGDPVGPDRKPSGKWGSWSLELGGGRSVVADRVHWRGDCYAGYVRETGMATSWRYVEGAVPVVREGYGPAGWQVLDKEKL